MSLRQSTLAVALVITLSAAAATTQVFADDGDARGAESGAPGIQTEKAVLAVPGAVTIASSKKI